MKQSTEQKLKWEEKLLYNFFTTSQKDGEFILHSETDREDFEKLKAFIQSMRNNIFEAVENEVIKSIPNGYAEKQNGVLVERYYDEKMTEIVKDKIRQTLKTIKGNLKSYVK